MAPIPPKWLNHMFLAWEGSTSKPPEDLDDAIGCMCLRLHRGDTRATAAMSIDHSMGSHPSVVDNDPQHLPVLFLGCCAIHISSSSCIDLRRWPREPGGNSGSTRLGLERWILLWSEFNQSFQIGRGAQLMMWSLGGHTGLPGHGAESAMLVVCSAYLIRS